MSHSDDLSIERPSHDSYDVHVGNLSVNATEKDLRDLFSQAGNVIDVFISSSFRSMTYGFVRYKQLKEIEKACKLFNGFVMHGLPISVSISQCTQERITGARKSNTNGATISKKPFPRREGANYVATRKDENEIHAILKKSLKSLKDQETCSKFLGGKTTDDFMKDFKEALVMMAQVSSSICVDVEMFEGNSCKEVKDLRDLISDFHSDPPEDYSPFEEVDFDLTKDSVNTASEEQLLLGTD